MFKQIALTLLQVGLATLFCLSQFSKIAKHGVENVNISMMLAFWAFVALGLSIAFQGWRKEKSATNLQTTIIYLSWTLFWGRNVLLVLRSITKDLGVLNGNDLFSASIIILAIIGAVVWNKKTNVTFREAQGRGRIALAMKATPQFVLAITFLCCGSKSWSGYTILTGHITCLMRLWDITQAGRNEGWSEERKALFQAELWNEISWAFVTLAWLIA